MPVACAAHMCPHSCQAIDARMHSANAAIPSAYIMTSRIPGRPIRSAEKSSHPLNTPCARRMANVSAEQGSNVVDSCA